MSDSLVGEVALLVSRALNMMNTNTTLGKRIVSECLNARSYEEFVEGMANEYILFVLMADSLQILWFISAGIYS